MVASIPLPVTTVFLLVLDLGTDIIPAISFAFEEGELDIMIRKPRSKAVRLVNFKVVWNAYGSMGMMQSFAAFVTYFVILNDFGFSFSGLFFMNNLMGVTPLDSDSYDPLSATLGNSNLA